MLTHRQARRKLGSRHNRRSNTNGKVFGATAKSRSIKRRYPKPVKNLGKLVAKLVRESQSVTASTQS